MAKTLFNKQNTLPNISEEEEMLLPCPSTIGPYRIESLFSKGGMSILYLATHPEKAKPIMIKILSPRFAKNKEIVDRFLKEAKIIAMTNHPNIIKLYDQGEWEKGLYIATEFIQGVSLRQFLLHRSLSQKRALEIILQVAYALSHLHTHGVIHRDLKPENILITENGEVKVIDFGIAQLQEDLTKEKKREKKKMIGTPTYMSPEQKENPASVTFSSDIFSLGMITYELVLGKLSHGVVQLSLLPKGLKEIIEKSLEPNIKKRYTDIVDFITDISHYLKTYREEKTSHDIESFEEIAETLQKAQELLFASPSPNWKKIQVSTAHLEGKTLSGLYIDFFSLFENRFLIVLGEPKEIGLETVISTAVLRGMVRSNVENALSDFHPVTFLSSLNITLCQDPMNQHFSFCALYLNCERNQISFASCGSGPILRNPAKTKKLITLNTPNPLLGADSSATIVETASNWQVGDRLFLLSRHCSQKEEEIKKAISDNLMLAPLQGVTKIVETLKKNDRIIAIINIQRPY